MRRSSRHKSSKHSSREGRDYSDSEKDSGLKERKGKEESVSHRLSREYASGEKRKYESKPVDGKDVSAGGYVEEYGGSSSKKRKEKVDDDRWTGGDADERESSKADKDLKGLSEGQSQQQASNQPVDRTREALNIVDQMVEEGLFCVGDKLWGFAVFECQKETFLSIFLLLGCNDKRMHFIEYAFADKKGEV